MSIEGCDFSDGRPGGKALAAAGKRFVCRYLAYRGNPDPRKPLTIAEIGDYFANGISIVANFESTSNRMLDGAAAGAADAADAKADLKGLGFPDTCPVYFSADFDPQPQYLARIDAYLTAAAGVLGKARVGIYGGIDALTHTRAAGTATWFWMAAGWDHGRQPPAFAHLWQYQTAGMGAPSINGASVDNDRALKDNYGQWDAPPSGGPAVEDIVLPITDPTEGTVALAVNQQLYALNGAPLVTVSGAASVGSPFGTTVGGVAYRTVYVTTSGVRQLLLAKAVVKPNPGVDCSAEVEAATAPLEARIAAATKVLNG